MEYMEDVMQFAKKGHMCPEAYTMASTLLQDMQASLSSVSPAALLLKKQP